MSVSGLCQICESRPARERCENCGMLVCLDHYDRGTGLCVQCAVQADPERRIDETDVNRF